MILARPAVAADRPFIVSGWSSSYRMSRDCTTPMALYARQKHEEVGYQLDRVSTLVAHGETGLLFGFISFLPGSYTAQLGKRHKVELHGYVLYVYVAGPFRRRGIARRLFAAADINPLQRFGYACRTRSSWELRSKIPLAEYEPFRARYEEVTHGRTADHEATGDEAGDAAEGQRPDPGNEVLAPRG